MDKTDIKKKIIIAGLLASFLTPFVRASVNVALPTMAIDLNLSAIFLTWLPTLYLLVTAILYVPFGRLGDLYGRKRIFQYGLIIFTVSSFLSAFSISGEMLLAIRIFQSIGHAMIFANLYAIITSAFPENERGGVLGVISIGVFGGLIFGPIIGGLLTQLIGWRFLFILDSLIGVVAAVVISRFKYEWAEATSEKFDILGAIILGISLTTIIYSLSTFDQKYGLFLTIAGIIGLSLFYLVEKRTRFPLIPMELFSNRTFTFGNITGFINYGIFITFSFLLNLYFQYIKGFDPFTTGLIVALPSIAMIVVSPLAGRLADRIDSATVTTAGMIVTTIGLAIMTALNKNSSLLVGIGSIIIFGCGIGLFYSPNTKTVVSSVEKKYYGVATATLSNMRSMGQIFGMGIAMLMISIFLGKVEISPANYIELGQSIRATLIILSLLCAVGIFTSLIKENNQEPKNKDA